MKFLPKDKPRNFYVGLDLDIQIKDLGEIFLEENEQITFLTENGNRHDFVRKEWGFYATPSINGRLKNEGFITALVKNKKGQIYIMVVEKEKLDLFLKYCDNERQSIIQWLSNYQIFDNSLQNSVLKCRCEHTFREILFEYNEPPLGETDFKFSKKEYYRKYEKCKLCNHIFSVHDLDMDNFYEDKYVESTYRGDIHQKFQKIISIPKEKSDNLARVKRIIDFLGSFLKKEKGLNLIDIGSGLGVFPYVMKKSGFNCTALDPDPKAASHLKEKLKIDTLEGDIFNIEITKRYNIATLNKVLEHVYDPVKMLEKATQLIENNGLIYIEVPDGETALKYGKDREEFFIEHHHVFSLYSLILLAESCNLTTLKVERIKEPSGKFTLIAFLKKNER